MKTDKKMTSIILKRGQIEELQRQALEFGYLQTRGPGAGRLPSVSQFLQAIADGTLKVTKSD